MRFELPTIDDCCDKEAYAFFGLAAYWAQVLEHSALNLAVVLQLPELNLVSRELFDELFGSLSKRTFGQLLRSSREALHISEEDEKLLDEALELRNILIHHYFRERTEDFVSEAGRGEMKEELRLIVSKFKRADDVLENLYRPLWEKYGVSDEFVEKVLAQMQARAEARDRNE